MQPLDPRARVVDTRTACEFLRLCGYPARSGTLRVWVHREILHPVGRTGDGQHTYRLGDLVDLLARRARDPGQTSSVL